MNDPHVRITVGEEAYAVPVAYVLEVAELGSVTAVPGAPAMVLGTCNLRGEILPVFDLARVIGIGRAQPLQGLLIVEHEGRHAGLAVGQVTDIEVLADSSPIDSAFIDSTVMMGEHLVGELSVPRTFAALRREVERAQA